MSFIKKMRRALVQGFRPGQLYNRGLFELSNRLRIQHCAYQPVWLHLYVSSRCNFRCQFCTNHAVEGKGRVEIGFHPPQPDMTMELLEEILGKFDRAMVCTFCGVGEPFLNRELFAMVRQAASRRMITEVVSNGSLLSTQKIDEILDSGLDRITVSLLESDADSHRKLVDIPKPFFERISGSIAELVRARDARGRKKPSIKISRVVTQSTRDRASDFIELGIALGVDEILMNNLIFSEIGDFEMQECLFDTPDNRRYFDTLKRRYAGRLVKLELPVLLKETKRAGCDWYWKNLSINSSGNVSGCGRFITPKSEYGTIRDPEIWNGRHFKVMRKSFNDLKLLECCQNCIEKLEMSQGSGADAYPFTIALTTYNRANFLRRNLGRVLEELGPDDELLVLDNNSSDDTADFIHGIHHPKVRYLFVERQGLNVSRNAALDEARHDDIIYLDDDAYPEPGWLAAFRYARLARPTAAIYAGRTELEFEGTAPAYLANKFRYLLGAIDYGERLRELRRWESPGGGNMLVNRPRLLSVSRFDERFDRKGAGLLNNGETELAKALQDHGAEILYIPNAIIHHWAGRDRTCGRWLVSRAYFQGVSDGLVAAKQRRLLWCCLRRIAFHCSKGPLEAVRRIGRPRALLFGIVLEVAKTAGTFGAIWHAN